MFHWLWVIDDNFQDLYSLIDEKFSRKNAHFVKPLIGIEAASYTTPAEFVEFVFERIANLSHRTDSEYNKNLPPQIKSADVYNIIDY